MPSGGIGTIKVAGRVAPAKPTVSRRARRVPVCKLDEPGEEHEKDPEHGDTFEPCGDLTSQ